MKGLCTLSSGPEDPVLAFPGRHVGQVATLNVAIRGGDGSVCWRIALFHLGEGGVALERPTAIMLLLSQQ
mgnify:CR=1 FL=1